MASCSTVRKDRQWRSRKAVVAQHFDREECQWRRSRKALPSGECTPEKKCLRDERQWRRGRETALHRIV